MVSSLDLAHPAENALDDNVRNYWISTGLFPQEMVLRLAQPCVVSSVHLSCTRVRSIRVEGCKEAQFISANAEVVAEQELEDAGDGQLQNFRLQFQQANATNCLRIMFLAGWSDFCSLHRVEVLGDAAFGSAEETKEPESAVMRKDSRKSTVGRMESFSQQRGLEVSIPETTAPVRLRAADPFEDCGPLSPHAPRLPVRQEWSQNLGRAS
eukprot:TRINITY_DN106076_c0_g1_i1.p1 TRINITY_DN106076_c0_g1~~TRINITY_DN106076_c0_g1_i1.p1  ORF type:complete len:236 (-),score=27.76 TRINITY_DN106076_c0_g1_i1:76-705(-)